MEAEKIYMYEQGSSEWLEFRKTKIGASDISKILGTSPYGTAYDLFMEKTNRKEVKINKQMRKGSSCEADIRLWYEEQVAEVFIPNVFISKDYEFAMASLDGITLNSKKILECKYCNKNVFEQAKDGKIVPHYYAQCQWQLMCVPKAEEVHYVCYNSGEYAVVITKRDEKFISKMVKAAGIFYYNHLTKDIPPEISGKDYVIINEPEAVLIAGELQKVLSLKKDREGEEKALRARLYSFTDDGNCLIGNLRLTRSGGREKIDYRLACKENKIDLAPYTKEGIGYWTITEAVKH